MAATPLPETVLNPNEGPKRKIQSTIYYNDNSRVKLVRLSQKQMNRATLEPPTPTQLRKNSVKADGNNVFERIEPAVDAWECSTFPSSEFFKAEINTADKILRLQQYWTRPGSHITNEGRYILNNKTKIAMLRNGYLKKKQDPQIISNR